MEMNADTNGVMLLPMPSTVHRLTIDSTVNSLPRWQHLPLCFSYPSLVIERWPRNQHNTTNKKHSNKWKRSSINKYMGWPAKWPPCEVCYVGVGRASPLWGVMSEESECPSSPCPRRPHDLHMHWDSCPEKRHTQHITKLSPQKSVCPQKTVKLSTAC